MTRQIRQRYPDRFGISRSAEPALVEGGGRMATSGKVSLSSKLTAEERRAGEKFVKEGLFKDLEAYARDLQDA